MNQHDGEEKSINSEKGTSKLPPRSDIHKKKKKKTKFKIKYPIIRLLALVFVLLPVAILSYKLNLITEPANPTPIKKSSNFESISYEAEEDKEQDSDKLEQEEKLPEETKLEVPEPDPEPVEEEPPTEEKETVDTENKSVSSEEETKQPAPKVEKPKVKYDVKYHKVKAEETLYRISMKYYNSRSGEDLIKRWNNINGDTVIEGQVLRIPIKIN